MIYEFPKPHHWLCFTAPFALVVAACSPQAADRVPEPTPATQTVHPISGLEVIEVTVTTDNAVHTFAAEVADTREAQSRGLMFRDSMGPNEAMIFPYPEPEPLSFWMKNTVLPLDIIFIDAEGRIINIGEGVPYNEAPVTSERDGIAVLELVRGRAEELGIGPGALVDW